jgi:hypothetical protein
MKKTTKNQAHYAAANLIDAKTQQAAVQLIDRAQTLEARAHLAGKSTPAPVPDPYIEAKLEEIQNELLAARTFPELAEFPSEVDMKKRENDLIRPILVQIYQDGHEDGVKDSDDTTPEEEDEMESEE